MDVAAGDGTSLPGVRLWNRPAQVIPTQRKVRARRKRRKELVLIQICLFGGLLLVVKGLSYLTENSGEGLAVCSAAPVLQCSSRLHPLRFSAGPCSPGRCVCVCVLTVPAAVTLQ